MRALLGALTTALFRKLGVRPTAAGQALYPDAKQALAALARIEATALDHLRGAHRELRLASSYTNGEFLVPDWVARFAQTHPGFRTQIQVINSADVLERVRSGDASMGFVEGLDPLEDMETQVVARDEIVAVVSAQHPTVDDTTVRLLGRVAYALSGLVDARIQKAQNDVLGVAAKMTATQLSALPVVHLSGDTGG